MKYEKPTVNMVGNAQALVLGTKHVQPYSDNVPTDFIQSLNAYEADE